MKSTLQAMKALPWTILFTLVLTSAGAPIAQAEDRALLIGIGEYPHNRLPGIDSDIEKMHQVAIFLGFEKIQILLHQNATLANIRAAFRRLTAGVKSTDRLLFYFGGHGYSVLDVNGDEPYDLMDEALVPFDFRQIIFPDGHSTLSNILVDDDIAELLSDCPAELILAIVDSCHSGTIMRSVSQPSPGPAMRSFRHQRAHAAFDRTSQDRPDNPRIVLLSAAQADQLTPALPEGSPFTDAIHRVVQAAVADRQLNLEQLRSNIWLLMQPLINDGLSLPEPQLAGSPALRRRNLFANVQVAPDAQRLRIEARLLERPASESTAIEPPVVLHSDERFWVELRSSAWVHAAIILRTQSRSQESSFRHLGRDYSEESDQVPPRLEAQDELRLLFPSPSASTTGNQLDAYTPRVIPNRGAYRLDGHPGNETLEILFMQGELDLGRFFDRRTGRLHHDPRNTELHPILREQLEELLETARRNTWILGSTKAEANDPKLPALLEIEIEHRP